MADKAVSIRLLRKEDDRTRFCSGNIELDRFFQRYAAQNQFRHYIGATYVAEIDGEVTGFITVSSGEITAQRLTAATKKRLPAYPLPMLRISRLAVDERYQGLGLGQILLRTALQLAVDMRDRMGCTGVVVDAKPEAVQYYESLGFIQLESIAGELNDRPQPIPMFLSIRLIEKR